MSNQHAMATVNVYVAQRSKRCRKVKTTTSTERILTLDYARLVTVLWGTLKAQQARVSALEVKVNEMNQKAKKDTQLNNNMYFFGMEGATAPLPMGAAPRMSCPCGC